MSRSAKELNMRRRYPAVDNYANVHSSGSVVIKDPTHAGAAGLGDKIKHGAHFATPAYGNYHRDSEADERLRDYYDTLEAVGKTIEVESSVSNIQRVAPIGEIEVAALRKRKEEQKKKKFYQYVMSDAHPSRPHTMVTAKKMAPEAFDAKMAAIENAADLATKRKIIADLGHGDDPDLIMVQYMDDQIMLNNAPSLVITGKATYVAGPYSICRLVDPVGLQANSEYKNGLYDDSKLYLSRSSQHYDGHGKYVEPPGSVREKYIGTFMPNAA